MQVQHLAKGLIEATRHAKHSFREEWAEQLVARYTAFPGKPIIHLDDLEDSVLVALDAAAIPMLRRYYEGLDKPGRYLWGTFRNIVNFTKGRGLRASRLGKWKEFANLEPGLPIGSLESHISFMRISDGKFVRTINAPKLPMNLATVEGAKILGYRGDVYHRNSAFTNENPTLHEDYRRCIRSVVGDITITQTEIESGGFVSKRYIRTNVGRFVTRLSSIAGLDNTIDQPHANNPAPLWLIRLAEEIVSAYLAALWDAEGSVNAHDIKLSQAVSLESLPTAIDVPHWPGTLRPRDLEPQCRAYVEQKPPLLLVSSAILLFSLGIASRLQPIGLSRSGSDFQVYWQLRIHKIAYARIFRDKIHLLSEHKQRALINWLEAT